MSPLAFHGIEWPEGGCVDFVACDLPSATRLTIHRLAAVADAEAVPLGGGGEASGGNPGAFGARTEAHGDLGEPAHEACIADRLKEEIKKRKATLECWQL
jgi:hypothetical protein